MSRYTSETTEWLNRVRDREKPYGMCSYHGVTLISVVQDEELDIRDHICDKGYVRWRVVNENPRKRRIRIISSCSEKRIIWDTSDSRVESGNSVCILVEVQGAVGEEDKYCYADRSVMFSVAKSGSETVRTTLNSTDRCAKSQFDVTIESSEETRESCQDTRNILPPIPDPNTSPDPLSDDPLDGNEGRGCIGRLGRWASGPIRWYCRLPAASQVVIIAALLSLVGAIVAASIRVVPDLIDLFRPTPTMTVTPAPTPSSMPTTTSIAATETSTPKNTPTQTPSAVPTTFATNTPASISAR